MMKALNSNVVPFGEIKKDTNQLMKVVGVDKTMKINSTAYDLKEAFDALDKVGKFGDQGIDVFVSAPEKGKVVCEVKDKTGSTINSETYRPNVNPKKMFAKALAEGIKFINNQLKAGAEPPRH